MLVTCPEVMFPVFVTGPAVHIGICMYILVTGPAAVYISILKAGSCGDGPPGGAREPAQAIK